MYTNWRTIPANTVWAIIQTEYRRSHSLITACLHILAANDYMVYIVDNPFCVVDHWEKRVALPAKTPELHEQMLLHETAEVLLRLPVAPEFHFIPTWRDEHHEVACLVERSLS